MIQPKSVPVNQADDASPFVATNEDVLIRRTINDWRHGLLPFEDARAAIEDRDLFDNALRQAGLERSLVLDLEWQALGKFRAHNSSRAISDLAAEDRERVQRALREEAVADPQHERTGRARARSRPNPARAASPSRHSASRSSSFNSAGLSHQVSQLAAPSGAGI